MKGSIFTRGIPIGQVSAVAQQDRRALPEHLVTPLRRLHTLDLVMVVL